MFRRLIERAITTAEESHDEKLELDALRVQRLYINSVESGEFKDIPENHRLAQALLALVEIVPRKGSSKEAFKPKPRRGRRKKIVSPISEQEAQQKIEDFDLNLPHE